MNRSAVAFIRAACGAASSASIPVEGNTASKAAVNLASDGEPQQVGGTRRPRPSFQPPQPRTDAIKTAARFPALFHVSALQDFERAHCNHTGFVSARPLYVAPWQLSLPSAGTKVRMAPRSNHRAANTAWAVRRCATQSATAPADTVRAFAASDHIIVAEGFATGDGSRLSDAGLHASVVRLCDRWRLDEDSVQYASKPPHLASPPASTRRSPASGGRTWRRSWTSWPRAYAAGTASAAGTP